MINFKFLIKIRNCKGIFLAVVVIFTFHCAEAQTNQISWNNPMLIDGSDFGRLFQLCYRQGRFDNMLLLTSSGSRKQFSDKLILKKYREMDFGYDFKLKSGSWQNDTLKMNYNAIIYGTKELIRMVVVVEHDSARIVLPDNFLYQTIFLK